MRVSAHHGESYSGHCFISPVPEIVKTPVLSSNEYVTLLPQLPVVKVSANAEKSITETILKSIVRDKNKLITFFIKISFCSNYIIIEIIPYFYYSLISTIVKSATTP